MSVSFYLFFSCLNSYFNFNFNLYNFFSYVFFLHSITWIFQSKGHKNQKVKLKDSDLLIRFLQIVVLFSAALIIWTVVNPSSPVSIISGTDLFVDCTTGWWENGLLIFELAFLLYGVYLSWIVRKAPSAFNESKHISISIYNWVLIGVLLQIVLQSVSGSPTFRYVINALQVLLTLPVVVILLFGSKFYLNVKGKGNDLNTSGLPRSSKTSNDPKGGAPSRDSDSHHTEEHEMPPQESDMSPPATPTQKTPAQV